MLEQGSGAACTLDFSSCRYLGPDAAALIYAVWLEADRLGQHPRVVLPQDPPQLQAFCSFSNLAHLLEGAPPVDQNHPQSETVPLRQFSGALWTEPNAVIDLVKKHVDFSTEQEDYLRTCMNEVVQNIADHARSHIGGVWCARFISSADEVRVAIVDRGLGILETLRKRYPQIISSRQALQCVFQGNYSSKSHKRNMGVGISNLARIISYKRGNLCIFTGNAYADLTSSTPYFREGDFFFPGTAVFFTLSAMSDRKEPGGDDE
ncbi:MAG: hypothetical protein JRF33_20480 [Deltaproteobacteria bacterium]|nr:hypothetical protein [Deltaproteobacteria bacterium]